MRRIAFAVFLIAGCGDNRPAATPPPAAPTIRTVTAGGLDSLPMVPVADGKLVCLSDGQNPCPNGMAMANWLETGRFATWELHRPVLRWMPGKVDPELLGAAGEGDSLYDFVVSVAQVPTGFVVLSASRSHALTYDRNGKLQASMPIPPISPAHGTGYSGSVPFYQSIHEAGEDSAVVFELREIDGPGDTVGQTVLRTRLDWLRLKQGRPSAPVPVFPILPSYAIASDSDVVWSQGDRFAVERRAPDGKVRWSLSSDATGPAVTPEEIAALRAQQPATPAARARFDSSVKVTGKFHPAIGAVVIAPDQRVLVMAVPLPSRDSIRYVTLSNSGEPLLQFMLPRINRVLLFAGDSILTQRPGPNAKAELRWLVIEAPAKP